MLRPISPYAERLVTTHVTASPVLAHTIGRLEHLLGHDEDADVSLEMAEQARLTASRRAFGQVERDAVAVLARLP